MNATAQKVALITGAGRGIGAATARRLAAQGWAVAAIDIDGPAAERVGADVGGLGLGADVAAEADVGAVLDRTLARYGRLDAVVSNAGINEIAPLSRLSLETWNRVLSVNLTAAFLLARAGEAALRQTKGAMVLISSTRAHMSEPNTLPYSASKGGLLALTHALAITLGPDVRVNCISPGWIHAGAWSELRLEDHAQHPVGRVGRPDDIAGAVAYLLSDDAGFITGAEFILDGGMTRKMIYV